MEHHHHHLGQEEQQEQSDQRERVTVVATYFRVLHAEHRPDHQADDADGNDPIQEAHDAPQGERMVRERGVQAFVCVQVDEDQQHQEDAEVAKRGGGHGDKGIGWSWPR